MYILKDNQSYYKNHIMNVIVAVTSEIADAAKFKTIESCQAVLDEQPCLLKDFSIVRVN